MKGPLISIATEAAALRQPSLASGLTPADYLATLKAHVASPKEGVSLRLFGKWLTTLSPTPDLTSGEQLVAHFAEDLESGRFRSRRGKYRSMRKQAPGAIFALHNRAFEKNAVGFLRAMLSQKTFQRLSRFAHLTDKTRDALMWFMEKGARPPARPNGSPKPLTAATRKNSVYAALQLLDVMKLSGLEQVKPELLPDPSPDAADYKTTTRLMHTASAVYRACVGKGLLAENPLAHVSHAVFDNDAQRDFLTPAMLAKLRDLSTVDLKKTNQVTDRLICLLYVDTAMRQKELASVRLEDVRPSEDGYQLDLSSAAQKMQNKPKVSIALLYPETNRLLGTYLKDHRGTQAGGLVLNTLGGDATGPWMAEAVKREAERIGVCTNSNSPPSPHDLRRTFATCNSKPLGLGMDINEIASRLRIKIEIAYKHYIQENPLLSELKTKVYRKKAEDDPISTATECIERLAGLDYPGQALRLLRAELARRRETFALPEAVHVDWMNEEDVQSLMKKKWGGTIPVRNLRLLFTGKGCADRGQAHGKIRYRRDAVEKFTAEYSPVRPFAHLFTRAQLKSALTDMVSLKIGRTVLIKSGEVAQFLKALQPAGHPGT